MLVVVVVVLVVAVFKYRCWVLLSIYHSLPFESFVLHKWKHSFFSNSPVSARYRCQIFSWKYVVSGIERFSFESRKLIACMVCITTLHDWLKNFAPLFHPIRSKTKLNQSWFVRHIFPALSSVSYM